MSKDTKLITSSVNLPIDIIKTLVNVDDKRFEVPVQEFVEDFEEKKIEFVRTMNTTVDVDCNVELTKYVKPEYIHINHSVSYINNVEKRTMTDENMSYVKDNLKFYQIDVEYADGRINTLIVPSYVKFYSMHKGTFVPVEQLKNRDILCEIGEKMVKVSDAELINRNELDKYLTKDYFNIKVTFERQYDENECIKEYPNLYINGILANIAYYNFNKVFQDTKN